MKLLKLVILTGSLLMLPTLVFAHTDLASSMPAAGTIVNVAPTELALTFTAKVQLLKVEITGSNGRVVAMDFKPLTNAASSFKLALPALEEDSYKVSWTAMGEDTHRVAKEFSFVIDASATASAIEAAPAAHTEHKH